MNKLKFVAVFLVVLVAGCVLPQAPPQLTPLEIQSVQTREYEAPKEIVFPSVLSVFQDLGYIVKTADKDTGFITAESPADNSGNGFWDDYSGVIYTDDGTGIWDDHANVISSQKTIATAFIEQIGKTTKARLNFVTKKSNSSSQGQTSQRDTPILDSKIYQNAFERIENAIFIRSAN